MQPYHVVGWIEIDRLPGGTPSDDATLTAALRSLALPSPRGLAVPCPCGASDRRSAPCLRGASRCGAADGGGNEHVSANLPQLRQELRRLWDNLRRG